MWNHAANHLFEIPRLMVRTDKRAALAAQNGQPAQQVRDFMPGRNAC